MFRNNLLAQCTSSNFQERGLHQAGPGAHSQAGPQWDAVLLPEEGVPDAQIRPQIITRWAIIITIGGEGWMMVSMQGPSLPWQR